MSQGSNATAGAEWSTDVAQGDWFTASLDSGHEGVGFVVPDGFDAMARVFHPVEEFEDRDHGEMVTSTWASLAEASGRIAHPEMQLHCIDTPVGQRPDFAADRHYASAGELPARERRELAKILGSASGVDRCWFGVWEGYGNLHHRTSRSTQHKTSAPKPIQAIQRLVNRRRVHSEGTAPLPIQNGPRIHAPGRSYLLIRGSLSTVDDAAELVSGGEPCHAAQTPNLWWPDDHSWFVVTEIDFSWTYVCGTPDVVAAVLASPILEALPADRSHQGHIHGDQLNI